MEHNPEAVTVKANGLNHRVWRWVSDGPDLLVVHGITNSARGWDFVSRALHPDFDAYAVDLRGHGESDKPERGYSAAEYAADLAGVIEALGLGRPMVLGHSLGARVAARMAADRPDLVSRLVLVDPPSEHRYPEQVGDTMRGFLVGVQATRAGGAAAARAANPHWTEEQIAARVEGHRQVSDRVMLDPIERYDPGTVFDDLPRIACPTLFVYGDSSYPGPSNRPGIVKPEVAERARAALQDGRLGFVERAGHMVPWDNFDGFMRPVRTFLRGD